MLDHHRKPVRTGSALAAAVLALLVPSLAAPPAAAAGPTSVVTVEAVGHSGSGAAGTCLLYRVVPRDAAYEESVTGPGQGAVSVTLTELTDPGTQDVDFCAVSGRGDAFSRAPRYAAGHERATVNQAYNPGETVTPEEAGNPVKARQDVPPAATSTNPAGRPDVAAVEQVPSSQSPTPNNNVLSADQAILAYDGEAGGFVFGVVGLLAGSARLEAFFDRDADGEADTAAPTPVNPGGDVRADPTTVVLSPGGAPWSTAAANAARAVEATPRTATVAVGSSGTPLSAVVRNAEGHPLAGVVPRMAAEAGPNAGSAGTWTGSCGATDSSGRAACSYAAGVAGTDTVVLWVNQAVSGATAGRDAGEPFDAVTVQAQSGGPVPTASAAGTPSATPTVSTSPSPSATRSATPSPTRSATPSATPSPTRTCATSVQLDRQVMNATHEVQVVVQAAADTAVQLLAYSRPHTTYRVVREALTGSDGRVVFALRPLTSTRLYAVEAGCPGTPSQVVLVRSALSLSASRTGTRTFAFQGRAVPARAGQLVSVHRMTSDGRQVLVGQVRADRAGAWVLRRTFTGTGRFGFFARTGADLVNAAGSSAVRRIDVR